MSQPDEQPSDEYAFVTKGVQGPERLAACSKCGAAMVSDSWGAYCSRCLWPSGVALPDSGDAPRTPSAEAITAAKDTFKRAVCDNSPEQKSLWSQLFAYATREEADIWHYVLAAAYAVDRASAPDGLRAEPTPSWPHDPSWRAWEQGGEWWVGNVATDGAMQLGEFFGPLNERHASRLATLLRAALGSAPRGGTL